MADLPLSALSSMLCKKLYIFPKIIGKHSNTLELFTTTSGFLSSYARHSTLTSSHNVALVHPPLRYHEIY